MKKQFFTLALMAFTISTIFGQDLISPTRSFSKKKISYVTLNTDTEIKGTLDDLDYKDGLIKMIKITDGTGEKHKLKPTEVKYMYLLPSGWDKYNKIVETTGDVRKWTNENINNTLINEGYILIESTPVKIKKKNHVMLMQLLNPDFSNKVKLYFDPFAKESASIKLGGVKVAGGLAKSYYIKLDTDPAAYLIEKKKYDKEFPLLWKNCKKLESGSEIKWSDLTTHILQYTDCN